MSTPSTGAKKRNATKATEAVQEVQEAAQAAPAPLDAQEAPEIKEDATEAVQEAGFMVEIATDVVNVRDGSALGFNIVTTLKRGEIVRISEELEDGWGRLASGAGFINLVYTRRV